MNLRELSLTGVLTAGAAVGLAQPADAIILLEPDPNAQPEAFRSFVNARSQEFSFSGPDGRMYTALLQPKMVVTPQRGAAAAQVPTGFAETDGVVKLELFFDGVGTFLCSGTLLPTRTHILTAAHCLTDEIGNVDVDSGSATFPLSSGSVKIAISNVAVHPDWDFDLFRGNDVAVLTLASPAPTAATSIDINRTDPDATGTRTLKLGYGQGGVGTTGATLPAGTFRWGMNVYDSFADPLLRFLGLSANTDFVPQSVLLYDFDNGKSRNDAAGFFLGLPDTGLGQLEASSAPGDSGGPTVSASRNSSERKVVGITSYGLTLLLTDVDTAINSSFGEFSGDTNVYLYRDFIDGVTSVR